MVLTKEKNKVSQSKYLSNPENRAKHRERCLAHYYNNKEKLSEQRKLYYQATKLRSKEKDIIQ